MSETWFIWDSHDILAFWIVSTVLYLAAHSDDIREKVKNPILFGTVGIAFGFMYLGLYTLVSGGLYAATVYLVEHWKKKTNKTQ